MIREEKKILNGITLNKIETNNYRRKKLIEVRKGSGSGRPVTSRCKIRNTFLNKTYQDHINKLRDLELDRVLNELHNHGSTE